METRLKILATLALLCLSFLSNCKSQQAPENSFSYTDGTARGFGKNTIGGKGGKVLVVTNLKDSGSGSLREAIEKDFPRVVVFTIGGTIKLKKKLNIKHPFITLAAQTAPGNGILLINKGLSINTSEVIIQGLRVRLGDDLEKTLDGISIIGKDKAIKNVLIDHCSISWAKDENIGINGVKPPISKVTIQNCIISEGIDGHSMGLLVNRALRHAKGPDSISIIGNIFASNHERNPKIGAKIKTQVANNLIYNWKSKAAHFIDSCTVDLIGNIFQAGPNTKGVHRTVESSGMPQLYLSANLTRSDKQMRELDFSKQIKLGKQYRHSDTAHFDTDDTFFLAKNRILETLLGNAGALPHDAVDRTILNQILIEPSEAATTTQRGAAHQLQRTKIADSDNDGIPDEWEIKFATDPFDRADAEQKNLNSTKRNIEVYIHSFYKQASDDEQ